MGVYDIFRKDEEEEKPGNIYGKFGNQTQDQTQTVEDRIKSDPDFNALIQAQVNFRSTPDTHENAETRSMYLDMTNDLVERLANKHNVDTGVVLSISSADPRTGSSVQQRSEQEREAIQQQQSPIREFGENVLRGVGGLMEPLMVTGDVARPTIRNVQQLSQEAETPWDYYMTPFRALGGALEETGFIGEKALTENSGWITYLPSLYLGGRQVGKSPSQTGAYYSGRKMLDDMGFFERFNVEDDVAKEWMGLGAEILTDPLLFADFAFLGAKLSRVSGFKNAAMKLEDTGNLVRTALSPRGVVESTTGALLQAGEAAKPFTRGKNLAESTFDTLNKFADNILDMRIPIHPGLDEHALKAWGLRGGGKEELPIRIRDFWQRGVAPIGRNNPPEWFTGGPLAGLSAPQQATGAQRRVQDIAVRGITDMANILGQTYGTRFNFTLANRRFRVPGARYIPEEARGFVNSMGENAWEFIDTVGVAHRQKDFQPYAERITNLAKLYDQDPGQALDTFKRLVDSGRKTTLRLGYEISGYENYTNAMKVTATRLGLDHVEMRRMLEMEASGIDLAKFMDTVQETGTGALPTRQVVSAPDPQQLKDLERFKEELAIVMQDMGNPFAHVPPESYLRGIREGYIRRVFAGKMEPEDVMQRLANREVLLLKEFEPSDLSTQFRAKWGDKAGDAIDTYLKSRPAYGTFYGGQIQDLLKHQGINASLDEIANVMYYRPSTPEAKGDWDFLNETIGMLQESATGGGKGLVPFWGRQPAKFAARKELNPDQVTQLVQMMDPVSSIASLGIAGGRTVKAEKLLNIAYKELKGAGQILSPEQLTGRAVDKMTQAGNIQRAFAGEAISGFDATDGIRYAVIPKNKAVWGEFAGTAIPEDIAREIVRTMTWAPEERFAHLQKFLSWHRRGLLAAFPTTFRNIVGNLLLQHQAGGDMFGILANLPRAHRARKEYLTTGYSKDLEGAEHLLPWMQDSTLTRQLTNNVDDFLERAADVGKRSSVEGLFDLMENVVTNVTEQPIFGGFLRMFKWGEETTRLASHLTTYDSLIARGVEPKMAALRAAHFATNATYDYGSLPPAVQLLHRSGAMLFPQFFFFTMGRTARAAYERPGQLSKLMHARSAANIAMVPEQEEQERISALMTDWLSYRMPLAVPVPMLSGKEKDEGHYYIANLEYFLPQGSLSPEVESSSLAEPFVGGAFKPIVETAMAWISGSGEAPVSGQFGQRVFDPSGETPDRVKDSLNFLLQNYVFGGQQRMARRFLETVEANRGEDTKLNEALQATGIDWLANSLGYSSNSKAMEMLGEIQGKHHNLDWEQFAGRWLGLTSYRHDVVGDKTFRQQATIARRNYQERTQTLNSQMHAAFANNDQAEMRRIEDLRIKYLVELSDELQKLATAVRSQKRN